jgi:uncharacterized protein YukE
MSGMIKISASELDKLSKDSKRQRDRVDAVSSQINSAVSGTDWRSQAAESFKALWLKDKQVLTNLEGDLEAWSKHCASQVPIAERVNKSFMR